jgi:uncharacterized protein (TIGR03435 family)
MSALAQTAQPSFEVATIRPSLSNSRNPEITPGSFAVRAAPLTDYVAWAYDIQDVQISGPVWMNTEGFEIIAKAETPATVPEMRLMMQTLLADRFGHVNKRERPEMPPQMRTLTKNGHKMKENDVPGSPTITSGNLALTGDGATIKEMVFPIARFIRTPVVDRTGLTGRYNFQAEIATFITDDVRRNPEIELPVVISQALQEQLGLKLDSAKVPVEVLVIDQIEKTPSEN